MEKKTVRCPQPGLARRAPLSPVDKMDPLKNAMGLRCFSLIVVVVAASSHFATCHAQQRTWTDASGTYTLEAELDSVTQTDKGLQAELIQADGKRMAILVSQLSAADADLAKEYFAESLKKKEDASKRQPEIFAPEGEKKISRSRGLPEESIVSRPLSAPIRMAVGGLDNRNVTNVKFDPDTAIRLEREIQRDEKGRPVENPVYKVKVLDSELKYLSSQVRTLVDTLKSDDDPVDMKRRAIEKLKEVWPQGRHPGMLKVLVNTMSHEDKFLRLAALDLLANHDSDQSLIYIFARIDDVSFDVRWRTFEILTQLRDPRVIPELCERLGGADRIKAANVLQVFGNTPANLIHEWVKEDKSEAVLLNVCQLLGNIGESDSIETLSKIKDHDSLLVRSQARNSIKQINRRLEQRASNPTVRR